jgi:hypothetical protein
MILEVIEDQELRGRFEFFGGIDGEVSEDAIGTRAFESQQTFHHDSIVI